MMNYSPQKNLTKSMTSKQSSLIPVKCHIWNLEEKMTNLKDAETQFTGVVSVSHMRTKYGDWNGY